jgi:hypothetical protein
LTWNGQIGHYTGPPQHIQGNITRNTETERVTGPPLPERNTIPAAMLQL